MNKEKLTLGGLEVYALNDGFFLLDGGAMFGVVPKVLWEKKCPADTNNRIKLSLNSLLVKTRRNLVLVETGIGSKHDWKFCDMYGVHQEKNLLSSLRECGYEPEDVDYVINTHLHFDHCGWNTAADEGGKVKPAFPRAKYIIQRGEWESALNPNDREKASYLKENFLPLEEHGRFELVEGDKEIVEGIEVMLAPGHTAHHQCVKISSEGKTLFFLGDMVPTSAHIGLSYIMSYDLYPLQTLESKKRFYEQAIRDDWTLAFVHDPEHYFGKVRETDDKFVFNPL